MLKEEFFKLIEKLKNPEATTKIDVLRQKKN